MREITKSPEPTGGCNPGVEKACLKILQAQFSQQEFSLEIIPSDSTGPGRINLHTTSSGLGDESR